MTFSHDSLPGSAEDLAEAENRMRMALNAVGSPAGNQRRSADHQPRARHQFVRDGEVPVVMLNSRKENTGGSTANSGQSQMSKLEAELYSERSSREKAERLLQQTNARLQTVQSQLTHAKVGQAEQAASLTELREQFETSQNELRQQRVAMERLRREHAEEILELKSALEKAKLEQRESRRPVGRPRLKPVEEKIADASHADNAHDEEVLVGDDGSEPVQWWIPGWQAKYRKQYATKKNDG